MKTSDRFISKQVPGKAVFILFTALLMAACASTPPPLEQLAVSRAAVTSASTSGANEFAPVQLDSATEKLAAADRAMTVKNYDLARQLAEEAQVDAELAVSMAGSAKAIKAAEAIKEDSRVLRNEIDRKSK